MTPASHLPPSASRRLLVLAACAAVLPLVTSSLRAADGSAVNTFVGGSFNWSDTTRWTGGTVATGTGAVATFNNNYTSTTKVNFGLGGGSTAITLGALNFTDTTPSAQITLQGGTGATANLTFADSDGVSEINVATTAAIPLQFGDSAASLPGTLNILGTDNLRINVTGTTNSVRFQAGVDWSGYTGKVTLVSGRYQTEAANSLPGASELEIGTGVQVRALFNSIRDQSVKGLSGGDASSSFFGANDNASGTGYLTLGAGTTASDSYTFSGNLGGNAFNTAAGQENSRFGIIKTGDGTQKFSGSSSLIAKTTVNGGTLVVNGTHAADTSLTGNLATGYSVRGDYVVNAGGTLAGNGTIKPYATSAGGVMIDIKSGGILAPGDGGIGALTLDNTGSVRSILNFSEGGSATFDLGAGLAADKLAIIGSAALASEVLFNNTVLNFNDLTAGSLSAGDYLLFDGDANTGYAGLLLGGAFSGASFTGLDITGGLGIGSGLAAYESSKLFLVGNDIFLNLTVASSAPVSTDVPESSSWAFAGIGALALGLLRRFVPGGLVA